MTFYDEEEAMEIAQYEQKLIKDVLGLDRDSFDRFKGNAIKGLIGLGNEFKQRLGWLLESAEIQDAVKIMNIWRKECAEYEMLHRIKEAKDRALKEAQSG